VLHDLDNLTAPEVGALDVAINRIGEYLGDPAEYETCRAELVERKYDYLIEWAKQMQAQGDLGNAKRAADDARSWAEQNGLDAEVAAQLSALLAELLEPTPTPMIIEVTPTPSPAPTPQAIAGSVQIVGVDSSNFPTLFVYVRVVDASGQPIAVLQSSDFRLFDGETPVQASAVTYFQQSPPPICAAVVVDTSGSMEGAPLVAAKAGAGAFLGLLADRDQVKIMGFSFAPYSVQDWTSDKQRAIASLSQLSAEGGTALWDALWDAANGLAVCQGRRALVALTDGNDRDSLRTRDDVVRQVRNAGASVFAIGIRGPDYDGTTLRDLVENEIGGSYDDTDDLTRLTGYYEGVIGAIQSEYRFTIVLGRAKDSNLHRLYIEAGSAPLVAEREYQDPNP